LQKLSTDMFNYELPKEFIAQTPVEPRDHSRLLVYNRNTDSVEHRYFYNLPEYLKAGDVLVINETRVLPARLMGKKQTGGIVELLLLNRREKDIWETLARPGRRIRPGERLVFSERLQAEVLESLPDGGRLIRFIYDGIFEEILDELGQMPLPPYITERLEDKERYQTVYSRETGSAAAPTAGLHFTPELLDKIRDMGVIIVPVLLHVGLGTFRPVKVNDVAQHKMHSEYYCLSAQAAQSINQAKALGGRVISVGTTSTRVLETACGEDGVLKAQSGWTDIFIYPGYKFKCVDCLITNFHLPQSTLLMLVSSLCSRERILAIYEEAKEKKYRFFSFGDAMFII